MDDLLHRRVIGQDEAVQAVAWLAKAGYEPSFGARPLKRLIQQEVETPLSRKIVAGEVRQGDTIRLVGSKEGVTFSISDK